MDDNRQTKQMLWKLLIIPIIFFIFACYQYANKKKYGENYSSFIDLFD